MFSNHTKSKISSLLINNKQRLISQENHMIFIPWSHETHKIRAFHMKSCDHEITWRGTTTNVTVNPNGCTGRNLCVEETIQVHYLSLGIGTKLTHGELSNNSESLILLHHSTVQSKICITIQYFKCFACIYFKSPFYPWKFPFKTFLLISIQFEIDHCFHKL